MKVWQERVRGNGELSQGRGLLKESGIRRMLFKRFRPQMTQQVTSEVTSL